MIEADEHLLTVLRYVEANPRRAGMVSDLAAYPWSSYLAHGLGRADPLLSEAPVWVGLGPTAAARQAYWREWVHTPLTERELATVQKAVTTARPYGAEGWVQAMALRLGINLERRPPGRPRKQTET